VAEFTPKTAFKTTTGAYGYPTGPLRYGIDDSHAAFAIPIARFEFFNPFGDAINAPTVYIRLPGAFNSTLSQAYSPQTGIFGMPNQGGAISTLMESGGDFLSAVQKVALGVAVEGFGFAASAGQSGKAQVEYMKRRMLNNFQQLTYQGPMFRRFQFPFSMKPVSKSEAKDMLDIISTFRTASAPKAGSTDYDQELTTTGTVNPDVLSNSAGPPKPEKGKPGQPEYDQEAARLAQEYYDTQSDQTAISLLQDADFLSFSYPDMCRFQLAVLKPGNQGDSPSITPLFESSFCVIENVSVDYGAGNKMYFHEGESDGEYYPSDVTLSISLQETNLYTAADATFDGLRPIQ